MKRQSLLCKQASYGTQFLVSTNPVLRSCIPLNECFIFRPTKLQTHSVASCLNVNKETGLSSFSVQPWYGLMFFVLCLCKCVT